ncbi:hypothetical protein HOD61_02250 [archaeon]|mgnify:FL=1|jgi:hypothetical protein|nr:hypothetical protein [archaeon]
MKKLINSINKLNDSELEVIITEEIIPYFRSDELSSLKLMKQFSKIILLPEIYSAFNFETDSYDELDQIGRDKLFILAYEQVKYDKKS